MLVAGMNPCPCGNYGSATRECRCTPAEIRRYIGKLSGPLLDRIDLYVTVDGVEYDELRSAPAGESSLDVKARVERARAIQRERFAGEKIHVNAEMNNRLIEKYCRLDEASEKLLEQAFRRYSLSARSVTRILKVARTVADIDGRENITVNDLAEAIQFKTREPGNEID